MEYFTEKNGRYLSRQLRGGLNRSPALRIPLTIIPFAVMAGIYIFSLNKGAELEDMLPILIGAFIFLVSAVLSIFLRKMGLGAGIIVDQMQGTVSYKLPGGQKHSIPIASVKEIGIQYAGNDNPGTGSGKVHGLLFLLTRDGNGNEKRHPVLYTKYSMEMRQLADELSILISATVNEYTKGQME